MYSDISISELASCKDGANIISKNNLNDELVEYIKTYNTVPTNIKNIKLAIVEFFDKINNVIVATDPNDTRHYNYQMVKQMCDDKGIEFANQSFASMVKQMRKEFMDIQRASFSKEFREEVHEAQGKCCQMCKDNLKLNAFHIDHIQALANGGTNDIDNLQILCKECHYVKTKEEAEEGWVKVSDTESSFNSETSKVFESELVGLGHLLKS